MSRSSTQAEKVANVRERWRDPGQFPARDGGRANESKFADTPANPSQRVRNQGGEPDLGFDDE